MNLRRSQVPWTNEQWIEIDKIVNTELDKARVVDKFIPKYPEVIPENERNIPAEKFIANAMKVDDSARTEFVETWIKFTLNKHQVHDSKLLNALALFRRAANISAQMEDGIFINGQPNKDTFPPYITSKKYIKNAEIYHGEKNDGLLLPIGPAEKPAFFNEKDHINMQNSIIKEYDPDDINRYGNIVVDAVYDAAGKLDDNGYSEPYALILSSSLYEALHHPSPSMVMPIDRVSPLVEGRFKRTSMLQGDLGVLISLSGDPVDLAIATKPTAGVYDVPDSNTYILGVYEKFALRLKESEAVKRIVLKPKPLY